MMGTLGELKRSTYVEFSFPVCVSHGRAAGRRPRTGTVQNNYTLFFPAVPGSATKTAQNQKRKEKKGEPWNLCGLCTVGVGR